MAQKNLERKMFHFQQPILFGKPTMLIPSFFLGPKIYFVTRIPDKEEFALFRAEIPRAAGHWNRVLAASRKIFPRLVQKLDSISRVWDFYLLPDRESIHETDDAVLQAAFKEAYLRVDEEDGRWHDMLHDLGAIRRREMYAAMKPSAYVLVRRINQ